MRFLQPDAWQERPIRLCMRLTSNHLLRLLGIALSLCLSIAVDAHPVETELGADSVPAVPVRHRRTAVTPAKRAENTGETMVKVVNVEGDTLQIAAADTTGVLKGMEVLTLTDSTAVAAMGKKRVFNPDPNTALWMSALCPGLGQIYNRRYWKLPIVVGAFVGLTYGTAWNNRMLQDYSRAYRDAMDNDPETRSYMNFYPPNYKESNIDMEWLKKALKHKKDYYRRYRDICILSMVGVYALSIIDAYVDASLAHFDISPDLSMKVAPTLVDGDYMASRTPSVGVQCSINF